jgi:hypothetical protein
MRQHDRMPLLLQLRHLSLSTLPLTTSPPVTTRTSYLLQRQPVFRVRRSHDDEAGGSTLPGQREVESPVPTITAAQVTQPDQLSSLISAMAAQSQATLQVQQ